MKITWENINLINTKIIPSSITTFKFVKNKNLEKNKKKFLTSKKKILKKNDFDFSPLFFDPFLDIENKKKIEKFYKKKKEKKFIDKKSLNCAKCFIEISRNFEKKKNLEKKINFYFLKNSRNLKINFFEKIEEKFGILENGEINFIIECKNCGEKIGFHNFNLNTNYLLRYLD